MTADNTDLTPDTTQPGAVLSPVEREQLSRVLFPDSNDLHTVVLLGKPREIHPLPIKPAQRLRKVLAPLTRELQKGIEETEKDPRIDFDAEEVIIRALEKAAEHLATFYKWEDVTAALQGDGLSLEEMQSLAVKQTEVSGNNDFLLDGLRTMVRWMKVAELMSLRFQSTLTGLR